MGLRDKAPYDGVLIAFCGVDGSGKSTQAKLLAESLRSVATVSVLRPITASFRGDETIKQYLDRGYAHDQMPDVIVELALITAVDCFRQMRTEILPRLQAGEIVLCDRYVYSVLARAKARGLDDHEWLLQLHRYLPEPDLTLYFDVRPQEALRRVQARGIELRWEETDPGFIATARSAFLEQPWGHRETYRIIDGELPVEEIAAIVRQLVTTTLGNLSAWRRVQVPA